MDKVALNAKMQRLRELDARNGEPDFSAEEKAELFDLTSWWGARKGLSEIAEKNLYSLLEREGNQEGPSSPPIILEECTVYPEALRPKVEVGLPVHMRSGP